MTRAKKHSSNLVITSLLLVLGLAIALLFLPLGGHDSDVHRFWIGTYREVFGIYSWFPRWSHRSNFGLGSPVFYFYPPLAYILTSLVSFVSQGASEDFLFRAAVALSTVISFWGMRWYLRRHAELRDVSIPGAILYACNPYAFYTFVTRGSLSEVLGFSLIPFVLGGIDNLRKTPSAQTFFITCISLALLCLSSVPLSLGCCFVAVVSIIYSSRESVRPALLQAWAIILGFSMAAILWLPAQALLGRLVAGHLWPPDDHSPLLEILYGGFPQTRTIIPFLFLIIVLVWARSRKSISRRSTNYFLRSIWIVCLVLQLPYVYNLLCSLAPTLHLLQFPWRLNAVLMFCTTIGVLLSNDRLATRAFAIGSVIVVYGVLALNFLHLHEILHSEGFQESRPEFYSIHMTGDSVDARIRRSASLPFIQSASLASVRCIDSIPYHRRYEVLSNGPARGILNLYYWPEWKAKINGAGVETSSDDLGRTTMLFPSGTSIVDLSLDKSKYETWGEIVSAVSLLLAALTSVALFYQRRSLKNTKKVVTSAVSVVTSIPVLSD
jgi:hypothetical protein